MTIGALIFYGGFVVLAITLVLLIVFIRKPLQYHPEQAKQEDFTKVNPLPPNTPKTELLKTEVLNRSIPDQTAVLPPKSNPEKTELLVRKDAKSDSK